MSEQIPNPEYFRAKFELMLWEVEQALETHNLGHKDEALRKLINIARKHRVTLDTYGNPSILSNVPENIH